MDTGGIVKAPLMIEMGMDPVVSAPTSNVMIFFTSITATSSYLYYGDLRYDYAWLLLSMGLLANVVGQQFVGYLVKRFAQHGLITLLIASLIAVSAVLLLYQDFVAI